LKFSPAAFFILLLALGAGHAEEKAPDRRVLLFSMGNSEKVWKVWIDREHAAVLPEWDYNSKKTPPLSMADAIQAARPAIRKAQAAHENGLELLNIRLSVGNGISGRDNPYYFFDLRRKWKDTKGEWQEAWVFIVVLSDKSVLSSLDAQKVNASDNLGEKHGQ
jgi:hypothetical protein